MIELLCLEMLIVVCTKDQVPHRLPIQSKRKTVWVMLVHVAAGDPAHIVHATIAVKQELGGMFVLLEGGSHGIDQVLW